MAWAMKDVPPLRCVALGGRQVRTAPEYGNIFDHFSVVYDYPNGARGFHSCRQQGGCFQDNSDYFMGAGGIAHIVRAMALAAAARTLTRIVVPPAQRKRP